MTAHRTAPPTIRFATVADVAALADLARALNVHQRDPTEHFTETAIARDGFGPDPAFETLIAERDGRAEGYALLYAAYETAHAQRGLYLCDLYVDPRARRRGVGRALVAAVARIASDRGLTFVWWAAKAWNAEAQRFYRALGAIEEPVVAYALAFGRLRALAAEAVIQTAAEPAIRPEAEASETPSGRGAIMPRPEPVVARRRPRAR